ncbi:MAG: phosphotransferase family protein, partial [Proteobacteria bacterium]|nr:phosphotransferase family protein [Pseudomonadota bacterium]
MLDQAVPTRRGEELDSSAIESYVKSLLPKLRGPCRIQQFPDGASNLTYLLSFENDSIILRRPPFGTLAKTAHDMGREYHVMEKLKAHYPYVPSMISLCEDNSVLGCPFYLMTRMEGIIPRADLPPGLHLSPSENRRLCEALIDRLVELHQIDYVKAGLAELGKPEGYVARQVDGWSKRFRTARTPDVPDFEGIMQWCFLRQPVTSRTCVIHNDFRLDNVVLDPKDPTHIIGVLDWEMATLGDPLLDLGGALAYWIEANDDQLMLSMRRQPSHLPGMMTRDECVAYYFKKSGIAPLDFSFYYIFGLFRLAVIAQQIYYRYYKGQTQDQRFAEFPAFIRHLEKLCQRLIASQGTALPSQN